jgi:hypothetical protein
VDNNRPNRNKAMTRKQNVTINLFKVLRKMERNKKAIYYYGHTVTGDRVI